jgi:hypothetical protein
MLIPGSNEEKDYIKYLVKKYDEIYQIDDN